MQEKNIFKQIAYLCFALLVSWVLVHFMAIFGIFLAVAIPILHLVFYPSIVCFWCQITQKPHRFTHSLIDSVLVIVVSGLSIAVVYGESVALTMLGFTGTPQTASFVIPSRNQYKLYEIFPMKIEIAGVETAINVVQADLAFDPKQLEVVDITTEGSFASIFLQKEHNNELGYIRLTGGVPNPGFRQNIAYLGTVYFRGKNPGLAEATFLDSSLVLANDGHGTNILKEYAKAGFIILPESIPQKEVDEQDKVIIQKQVLGDTVKDTEITLYEFTADMPGPMEGVLGTATTPVLEPPQGQAKPLPRNKIAQFLARIDNGILRFWKEIIQKIR